MILDNEIKVYVFIPIIAISFLIGVLKHFATIYFKTLKKSSLKNIRLMNNLYFSQLLRKNNHYINQRSYLMRYQYLTDIEHGILNTKVEQDGNKNILQDPNMAMDMMKENICNVTPMIIIGGWINYTFNGFLATKLPFYITESFKSMFQKDIERVRLEPTWVSSVSLYFISIFGMKSLLALFLKTMESDSKLSFLMDSNPNADIGLLLKNECDTIQTLEHKFLLPQM